MKCIVSNMPLHGRRGLQVEALFVGDHHIHSEGVGGVDWGGTYRDIYNILIESSL